MDGQPTTLTELLKQHRIEAGLSFQSLSIRSAVDVAYLHRLEIGQAAHPSRDIILKIGIGLGLDLQEIDNLIIVAGHWPLIRDKKMVNTLNSQALSVFGQ